MEAELILYAVIAAGLVFWLRSILGTRHGEERERPNPFTQPAPDAAPPKAQEAGKPLEPVDVVAITSGLGLPPLFDLPRNVTLGGASVEEGLVAIGRQDRGFDFTHFITGAQDAFVIIVEAFAQGDRETLRNLLSDSVYAAFDQAITEREARGETINTEIHAVRKMDVMEARSDGHSAFVTIRFIADETCVVKDASGVTLAGDPDRITEMNDIWTFSKPIKSRDPRWLLQETRDGDVAEDPKTKVPDAV